MHHQTKKLEAFYDSQAEKFSGTRKRHWPEFDIILAAIKAVIGRKNTIRILEVGCGD
jgi:ubiquinone/menaquinone biosynthesis C-methylase UbiE